MSEFHPSGIVTMATDFGHKGPFAGVMRGVILSRFAGATIVDLAHDIPAAWPPEAGFWISRSWPYFPVGTIHIAIVDPGQAADRDILAVDHGGHIFLAPDNGLLDPVIAQAEIPSVYRLNLELLHQIGIRDPSPTFQGRDIFAPVAAEIAAGRIELRQLASTTSDWTPGWIGGPEVTAKSVSGVVVSVDGFGNLMTNIDASLIKQIDDPVAHIAGHHLPLEIDYGRAQAGEFIGLINSFDVLEIARVDGSAADGLGVERGAPVTVAAKS